jgi:hypothetical protein
MPNYQGPTENEIDFMTQAYEDLEKALNGKPTLDEVLEKFYGFHWHRKTQIVEAGKLEQFKADAKKGLEDERNEGRYICAE